VRGNAGSAVNELPNEHDTIQPLGSVETVMEASLCPMCSRALEISTIEPHPTRDGVDVVTRRCPIHGDIWRSVVVNEVEAAHTGHRDACCCDHDVSRHGSLGRAREPGGHA
jgi:hypothetical protein